MAKEKVNNKLALNKDDKILVIIESPNKMAHINKYFKQLGYKNIQVLPTVGHTCMIKNDIRSYKNTGIFPNENFRTETVINPEKKEVIEKIKDAIKWCDMIVLASDEDREGEKIVYDLHEQLKIPDKKYVRATFHEITQKGIERGLQDLRKIDYNLAHAALAREILDKLVGFTCSPLVQQQINCKSAGRCQSAGQLILVDRENEILNFKPEKFYELHLHFVKNKQDFIAKYIGKDVKDCKICHFSDEKECQKVINDCKNKEYLVNKIERKQFNEYPKPPFITSTLQQEANKRLGFSVETVMSLAQKLFDQGKITYLRTDDSSMSPEFLTHVQSFIKAKYGPKYCGALQQGRKNESAQEAHECIRPTNINTTPSDFNKESSNTMLNKLYKLIWERTVMSTMTPALIGDTQYFIIPQDCKDHNFIMHSKEIIFDGYRIVKGMATGGEGGGEEDQGDETVKETFKEKEKLQKTKLLQEEFSTQPPSRYSEASFIHTLEKMGIGRPSTYASIVKVILDPKRGYCTIENKKMVPTPKGMKLAEFLTKNVPDIINLNYTKDMEKSLDDIAEGKLDYLDFLKGFFKNLDATVKKVQPMEKPKATMTDKKCPKCGKPLVIRHGKYGEFLACSGFPKCRYIEKMKK